MTQKASQVSAAATRRGDAAARQISCSHQNAQPSLPPLRDSDVQDQSVERSVKWDCENES